MDPNATLAEINKLLDGRNLTEWDIDRLTELWSALDQWMRRGGFLPMAWMENR